jgi:hypothetical protein
MLFTAFPLFAPGFFALVAASVGYVMVGLRWFSVEE